MSVDYDKPRTRALDESDDNNALPIDTGKGARPDTEIDDLDIAETFSLPDSDLSGEELTVRVVPKQADEFTCTSCFLVHHRSQLADASAMICRDCA